MPKRALGSRQRIILYLVSYEPFITLKELKDELKERQCSTRTVSSTISALIKHGLLVDQGDSYKTTRAGEAILKDHPFGQPVLQPNPLEGV